MSRPSRVEDAPDQNAPADRWSTLIGAWVGFVARRAAWVLLLAAAATAASLYLAYRHLGIDTDTSNMISEDVPFRRHDTAFRQAFPKLDGALVVVIDGTEPEAAARDAGLLAARLRASPHFEDVYWATGHPFLRRNGLLHMQTEALARLADRLAASEPLLGALAEDPSLAGLVEIATRAFAQADEVGRDDLRRLADGIAHVAEATVAGRPGMLSWRRLVIDDDREAREIILARPRLDTASLSPARAAMAGARALAGEIGIGPQRGTRLRLTGKPAMRQEELESSRIGGTTAGLLSLALVAGLLGLGLRSPRLVVATLVTLTMGLSWSAGFATLAIGHLNLLSVAFAVLFIGLAVDFSIHFCLRFREEVARDPGGGERAALVRAGRGVARGLAIAALAAGLGFLAFLPTDYRGFAELGLISGVSMGLAYLANLTVLPALMAVLAGGFEPRLPPGRPDGRLERLVTRHHRTVLAVSIVATLAAALLLPRVGFDLNPVNLRDPDTESVATFLELSADPDSSPYGVDVLVADLAAARRMAEDLGALDPVRRTLTLASFVPADQDEKLAIVEDMALYLAPLVMLQARPREPGEGAAAALDRAVGDWKALAAERERLSAPLADAVSRAGEALARVAAGGETAARILERRLLGHFPRMLEDLALVLEASPSSVETLPANLRERWVGAGGIHRVNVAPVDDHDGGREPHPLRPGGFGPGAQRHRLGGDRLRGERRGDRVLRHRDPAGRRRHRATAGGGAPKSFAGAADPGALGAGSDIHPGGGGGPGVGTQLRQCHRLAAAVRPGGGEQHPRGGAVAPTLRHDDADADDDAARRAFQYADDARRLRQPGALRPSGHGQHGGTLDPRHLLHLDMHPPDPAEPGAPAGPRPNPMTERREHEIR